MSRRRRPKSPGGYEWFKLDVYCTKGGTHGEDRIARVYVRLVDDDQLPYYVRVEYIGLHDSDDELRESWESRTDGQQFWRTHTFRCAVCRWDAPVRDDRLGQLVVRYNSELGKRRVELTDLRDALT